MERGCGEYPSTPHILRHPLPRPYTLVHIYTSTHRFTHTLSLSPLLSLSLVLSLSLPRSFCLAHAISVHYTLSPRPHPLLSQRQYPYENTHTSHTHTDNASKPPMSSLGVGDIYICMYICIYIQHLCMYIHICVYTQSPGDYMSLKCHFSLAE